MKKLALLLLCLSILSCQKLNIERQNLLKTEIILQSNEYVIAKSSIIDISKEGIVEHGHCWNTSGNPTINNNKTINGDITTRNDFSDTLYGLSPNLTYYVRAYVSNGTEIKYGEQLTITPLSDNISISNYNFSFTGWTSGKIKGKVNNIGSIGIIGYGHCWDTISSPIITNNFNLILNSDETEFESPINNLLYNKTYYVRSFVKITETNIVYSNNEIQVVLPKLSVSTNNSMLTGSTSAILYGSILSCGVYPVTDHGFCWSYTTSTPTLNNNKISLGSASQAYNYQASLIGIVQNNTLYFRAFAIENNVVTYGDVLSLIIN